MFAVVALSGCEVRNLPENETTSQEVAQKSAPKVGMLTITTTTTTTPIHVRPHLPLLTATMPSMKIVTEIAGVETTEVCFPKANSAMCKQTVKREIREGDHYRVDVDERTCIDCYSFEYEGVFGKNDLPMPAEQDDDFHTAVVVSFSPR
jgi:hypothetical protein